MPRKSPINHRVRQHTRKNGGVPSYLRGKGIKPVSTSKSSHNIIKDKMIWFEKTERKSIAKRGGVANNIVNKQDGNINGVPVDVKAVKKDNRFRIDEDNHAYLLANGGAYIFVNGNGKEKRLSAVKVNKLLYSGPWFKDRSYPHKFVRVHQIFK